MSKFCAVFSAETFARQIDVNWMGVVRALGAVIPGMVERRAGQIAVVGSVSGYRGLRTAAAYGATKAALINMCEALQMELGDYGIKVQIVNPGFVETPLTDRNDFPMPFLVSADDAARRIVEGLKKGRREIAFPRRFTWLLRAFAALPGPLVDRIAVHDKPDAEKLLGGH